MKIYTRTGDGGTSGLYSGERLAKSDVHFEILGTLDELNAMLGLARAAGAAPDVDALLRRVQEHLFELGADLATLRAAEPRITGEDVAALERAIDSMDAQLPPLRAFILPGGHPAAAQIHVARGICRRAERLVVALSERRSLSDIPLAFLNRLSDVLFTAARFQNHLAGVAEDIWTPRS